MKYFILLAMCFALSAEVYFTSSPNPNLAYQEAPKAPTQATAFSSTKSDTVLFENSRDEDYFYFAVESGSSKPKFLLGQFELPMASTEDGYPRDVLISGKKYNLYRSFYQVGGAKTEIVVILK